MAKENKLVIYQKYSELLDGIFVYQNQQIDLREMCLQILIGTFILVIGLLFIKVDISGQAILTMSALFPFLALIIITVNLVIDLVYKERLKLAFISEALRLEKTYSWLPKFHISLVEDHKEFNSAANGQIIYYLGSSALMLLMSAISLSINPIFSYFWQKILILLVYFCVYLLYHWFMSKIVKKTETILGML